jgi:pyrroline-5-carboxylate reductase
MSTNAVGWIGSGRIARIMLGGWQRAGRMPAEVAVHDPDEAAVARLREQFPAVTAAGSGHAASRSRWLFLGVHPPQIGPALADLHGNLHPETVIVSLAPKVTLAKLSDALGGWGRVARVLPNAASTVGAGYNPVAFGPGLPAGDREGLVTLLAPLGPCPEVPEEQLEAYAVVTAMGPTYAWFQWQALEDLAKRFGIPEDQARPALRCMLAGALAVYFDSGLTPAEVTDLIPVRPLQEHEVAIRAMLEEKLSAIHQKLKP